MTTTTTAERMATPSSQPKGFCSMKIWWDLNMSVFMCHLQIRIYREIRSTSARYVPVCVCVSVCIHINVCACMCACMFCLFVCMYVRMYACINVSIRVCQYVCTYVCSMYVHLYTVSLYNAHSSDENSVSCTIPGFTP